MNPNTAYDYQIITAGISVNRYKNETYNKAKTKNITIGQCALNSSGTIRLI